MSTRQHELSIDMISGERMEYQSVIEKDMSKRHSPDYSQVCAYIPKQLALQFKAACTLEQTNQSSVIEVLVADWLAKRESRQSEGSDRP